MQSARASSDEFPSLPQRNDPLSEKREKNHRARQRPSPPQNLFYEKDKPITTMEELQKLLGVTISQNGDETTPFHTQVITALSEIQSVSVSTLKQKRIVQEETLDKIIQEEENLTVQYFDLKKLQQVEQKRFTQEKTMSEPPVHISLRNFAEAMTFMTPSDVQETFNKLPHSIQQILLRVPNLIPDNIKLSEKPMFRDQTISYAKTISPVLASSQAVVEQVFEKSPPFSPIDTLVYSCCGYLQKSKSTESFAVLDRSSEITAALKKLQDGNHTILENIVIQSGISDNLTELPSLAIMNGTNSRHLHQPNGVIPVIILYHQSNESKVREKIDKNLSEGVWSASDKEMLSRVVAIRKRMFNQPLELF